MRTDGRIELAFDRLLLPRSALRQSFAVTELQGKSVLIEPTYDPVARVVTLTPQAALQADHIYRLTVSPANAANPDGLQAVDGTALAAPITIQFTAVASGGTAQASPPSVDFCKDILPIFQTKCGGGGCHGGKLPAAGLVLDTLAGITATAVGQVAHGSNTGPRSAPQGPTHLFGIDMPIVDPGSGQPSGGNPGQSWLLYKSLLAPPATQSNVQGASACDGGTAAPTDVTTLHALAWQPITDTERAALADQVLGREMPFPTNPATPLGQNADGLTTNELERVSRWIAQSSTGDGGLGALVPSSCPACVP